MKNRCKPRMQESISKPTQAWHKKRIWGKWEIILIASIFTNLVTELNMAASKESSLSAAHDYLTIRNALLQSIFHPPGNVIFPNFFEYFLHRFLRSERHLRYLTLPTLKNELGFKQQTHEQNPRTVKYYSNSKNRLPTQENRGIGHLDRKLLRLKVNQRSKPIFVILETHKMIVTSQVLEPKIWNNDT